MPTLSSCSCCVEFVHCRQDSCKRINFDPCQFVLADCKFAKVFALLHSYCYCPYKTNKQKKYHMPHLLFRKFRMKNRKLFFWPYTIFFLSSFSKFSHKIRSELPGPFLRLTVRCRFWFKSILQIFSFSQLTKCASQVFKRRQFTVSVKR